MDGRLNDRVQDDAPVMSRNKSLGILGGGFAGGLLLIITIIFFLKYCIKLKRKREMGELRSIKSLVGHIQPNLRAFKLFRGTKESDSTAQESTEITVTVGETSALNPASADVTLCLDNEIDAAVAEYRHKNGVEDVAGIKTAEDTGRGKRGHIDSVTSESEISRHVSFEVDEETAQYNGDIQQSVERPDTDRRTSLHAPPLHHKSISLPSSQTKLRYTEGDFHHLKGARIDRSPQPLSRAMRQRSLPVPAQSPSHTSAFVKPNISYMASHTQHRSMRSSIDYGNNQDDDACERTPMLSPLTEDRIAHGQRVTMVTAEIHAAGPVDMKYISSHPRSNSEILDRSNRALREFHRRESSDRIHRKLPNLDQVRRSRGSLGVLMNPSQQLQVRSLDYAIQRTNKWLINNRQVKSYEEDFIQLRGRIRDDHYVDYDRFKITEFSRMPYSNPHFGTVYDSQPDSGKVSVRYNDIGSFEEINDEVIDGIVEDIALINESETDTINGSRKYKELWTLRSTFEEDEELSDTIRMEDHSSPEEMSPEDKEQTTSVTTSSFDSNTEPTVTQSHKGNHPPHRNTNSVPNKVAASLLPPKYENRRRSYQNIFIKRSQRTDISGGSRPNDTSFDSFETMDTDGDVSESSRQEVTTTSFESSGTTDNTDSTGDSSSHKLQSMRGDSGYKSLETQNSQSVPDTSPKSPKSNYLNPAPEMNFDSKVTKRSPKFAAKFDHKESRPGSCTRVQAVAMQQGRSSSLPESHRPSRSDPHRTSHYFDRRAAKTASKKRRDFRAPKYNARINESVQEVESDSRSDQPSGDSFEDTQSGGQARFSIFNKIMHNKSEQSQQQRQKSMTRDYSIDKKTDEVFNDFMRYDESYESRSSKASSSRHSPHRQRLQRKHSEAIPVVTSRRGRYSRGARSVSVDLGSTVAGFSGFHKISPQDSIEEEDEEAVRLAARGSHSSGLDSPHKHFAGNHRGGQASAKVNQKIPVIMLEEDSVEA